MSENKNSLQFITPFTEDGPLYPPVEIPIRSDFTNGGKAKGQPLVLMGLVYNYRHQPVSGTRVEIWQTDSNGYYDHPRAQGDNALDEYWKISKNDLDPNFSYFGAVRTNQDGIYWFQTVVPRWYHVFGADRAAHIHIKIRHADNGVLTSEIYFPGEEADMHRAQDPVFSSRGQKSGLLIDFQDSMNDRLPGVPAIQGARYGRKDLYFL